MIKVQKKNLEWVSELFWGKIMKGTLVRICFLILLVSGVNMESFADIGTKTANPFSPIVCGKRHPMTSSVFYTDPCRHRLSVDISNVRMDVYYKYPRIDFYKDKLLKEKSLFVLSNRGLEYDGKLICKFKKEWVAGFSQTSFENPIYHLILNNDPKIRSFLQDKLLQENESLLSYYNREFGLEPSERCSVSPSGFQFQG